MNEDGPCQAVARLALVEFSGGATAQFGILEPIEGEQGPLDPADLPQGQGQAILSRIPVRF